MADGIEVAKAFITIIPAFEKGTQKKIGDELIPETEKPGEESGKKFGQGFIEGCNALSVALGNLIADAAEKAVSFAVDTFKEGFWAYADYEQYLGGIEKIFDEMDTSRIYADAAEAYRELGMSANEYMATMTNVGATFASTMGDERGYDTARRGMMAISDYASGTGKNLDELNQKYMMISRSTGSYQSIADQFSGILPATSAAFLEQAQAAGYLSDEYTSLTEVPIDEYQEALSYMLADGVDALNLTGNTAAEAADTLSGSFAAMKSAWTDFTVSLMSGDDEALGDAQEKLLETVKNFLKNAAPVIIEGVKTIITSLPDIIAGLGDIGAEIIRAIFPDSADTILSVLGDIQTGFSELFGAIGAWFSENGEEFAEKFKDLMGWISDHGTLIKVALIGIAGGLLAVKLVSTFAPALSALAGAFGKLGTNVPKAGKAAGASATQMLALGASLLMVGGAIALAGLGFKFMADAAVQLADAGGAAIGVFFGMIGAIIGIGAALLIAAPGLTAAAPGLLAFGAAMLMVAGAIGIVTLAISYLVEVLAANAPQLVELMQGAADAFTTACDGIAEAVSKVVTAIADGATQIIDAVSRLVTSVGDAISGVLDSLAGVFDSIGNAALNAGTGMDMLVNALIKLTNETGVVDLGASCEEAARGIKNMSQAAGDGAGLNAVATSVQLLGTMGMVAATSSMMIAQGMMMISANAASAQAAVTAFVTAIVSSGAQLNGAAQSIRTFAGSQMVIQAFSRNAVNALKMFGMAAQTYSNQAVSAVRVAMASMAAVISGTRLQMQPINVGKLPHFRFEGTFNAQTGQTPAIRVDWYAGGGVFSDPTIIGVGDARSPEIVTPEALMADTFDESLDGSGIREEIKGLREDVRNVKLYLDGSLLVGGIADRMDTKLGMMQTSAARGF